MAEEKSAAKMAAGMSTAAAIAAALAWLSSRKAAAAPGGEITLPPEFVQLITAIAASSDSIDGNLLKVITELAKLAINVQGFPANAQGIRSFSKLCAIANQAYQGDDMMAPEGMSLVIKSYPINAVGSLVRVASSLSDATNPNSSWPLIPNEAVAYQVQNANQMYVSATVAGSLVVFSVERAEFRVT
jgi:hypothetical protein